MDLVVTIIFVALTIWGACHFLRWEKRRARMTRENGSDEP
jgi:hypothetical protein